MAGLVMMRVALSIGKFKSFGFIVLGSQQGLCGIDQRSPSTPKGDYHLWKRVWRGWLP
jgi:hypothetical protein